jgi:arginase
MTHGNRALKSLPEVSAWTQALGHAAFAASAEAVPIFLGGDHSISAGTLNGLARRAEAEGRPLFVLWLDAHPDFHTLDTSVSGNLHGVPLAYAIGLPGFAGYFPDLPARVDPGRICMLGIRSVDDAEHRALADAGVMVHGMDALRSRGIAPLLAGFLDRVKREDGLLHVSLDVDFLDPSIAPGVGTAVPQGTTLDEARQVMDLLRASGRVTSLDLVELNPVLDDDGRTAALIVDLTCRLLGRHTSTRSH